MNTRRGIIPAAAYATALLLVCLTLPVRAGAQPMQIVVSTPGPGNLTYLPVDLIGKIGADRAEGAVVKVRHTGGGSVALRDLATLNADFAVAGLPAAMSLRANGGKVTAIAAVSGDPLFVLMVRTDLKGSVKKVSDLRGRAIGVNTSSLASKTTSQQLAELVLKRGGVRSDEVRIVAAGQSWDAQSSVLSGRIVDAVMGDEPFASRLQAANRVFFLVNLADPKDRRDIPGSGFLHAALETRDELLAKHPAKAEKMVRILRRTLEWMAKASPEEIADKAGARDPEERRWLVSTLRKYPRMYSPDGRFSSRQLEETALFFRESSPEQADLRLADMIQDRWCGRAE